MANDYQSIIIMPIAPFQPGWHDPCSNNHYGALAEYHVRAVGVYRPNMCADLCSECASWWIKEKEHMLW